MRINILFLFSFFILAACHEQPQSQNQVYEYLKGAELQCEDDQRAEVIVVLNDLLTLPAEELKKKRYNNYVGIKEWPAPFFIERHFVPDTLKCLNEEAFYKELADPRVKQIIGDFLEKMSPTR